MLGMQQRLAWRRRVYTTAVAPIRLRSSTDQRPS